VRKGASEMPPYKDLLVCGVSTQVHDEVRGFDELVSFSDADFSSSGLKSESLVRLGFLAMLPALQDRRINWCNLSSAAPAFTQQPQ